MYFNVPCTHCGKSLRVRQEHIGRKVGCPYCHGTVVIAQPESETEPAPENWAAESLNRPAPAAGPPVAGARTAGKARRKPAAAAKMANGASATGAPLLWTALLGAGVTLLYYGLLFPMPQTTYFRQLFWERQWVPFVEAYLFFWSLAILLFKWRQVLQQQEATLFDLLPNSVAPEITLETLPQFVRHLETLPARTHASFLLNRVRRGLEHFRVRRSASEVATILGSQSEIDTTAVDSSYALLKVFIWAIPILGFIGTVQGLGEAVSGFSSDLAGAKDISVVKESLGGITLGLGVAFDTTLIALVMSILLMFPMSALQKTEDDLLNSVNEYCNENLLKRLNDGAAGDGPNDMLIRRAIANAMSGHHAELNLWAKKLELLSATLTQQVAEAWKNVHAQAQTQGAEQLAALSSASAAMLGDQRGLVAQLLELEAQFAALQASQARQFEASAKSLGECQHAVQLGLSGVNDLLARLGGQQVIIEQHVQPQARRGWFGWGGRRG